MKKPDFCFCSDCEHYYWYAGLCNVHSDDDELGIDHMMPEIIEKCVLFEIKTRQELGYEHYDKLPSAETVAKVRGIRLKMYRDLLSVINGDKR